MDCGSVILGRILKIELPLLLAEGDLARAMKACMNGELSAGPASCADCFMTLA